MKFEKVSYNEWFNAIMNSEHERTLAFKNLLINYMEENNIEPVKIYASIELPKRSTVGSAGYDFFSYIDLNIKPGEIITIPTAIKWDGSTKEFITHSTAMMQAMTTVGKVFQTFKNVGYNNRHPKYKYFLSIYPRSSLGRDYSLREPNIVSIIDADYYDNESNEGHIMVNIKNEGNNGPCLIKAGQAYAQGIIQQFMITDDDNATGERKGGFGSTNKKG